MRVLGVFLLILAVLMVGYGGFMELNFISPFKEAVTEYGEKLDQVQEEFNQKYEDAIAQQKVQAKASNNPYLESVHEVQLNQLEVIRDTQIATLETMKATAEQTLATTRQTYQTLNALIYGAILLLVGGFLTFRKRG